jgi:thioesterase domain-containing protein/aryl carrier-like protein
VGLQDNFFELGGHSLLIVQLQSRIRREFSRELSIAELFQRPTIAQIAELLDGPAVSSEPLVPAAHVEGVMTEIWRDVLKVDNVGLFDNFFELGGNELSATRLLARMQTAFEMDLPLRCLFIEPTIAGLAKHIRYDVPTQKYRYVTEIPRWNCLVPAQPRGTRTPLFFVAGYQGPDDTLLVLSRIIPFLGLDQPVFGFRPRWIDGDGKPYASIQEAAGEFLAELRTTQPHGPYLLGGHCVGGVVALEMARQLMREGEEVKLLALLDTERPNAVRAFLSDFYLLIQRGQHIAEVIGEILKPKQRSRKEVIGSLLHRKLGIAHPESPDQAAIDRFYDLRVGYRRLAYQSPPKPYPGPIKLVVNDLQHRLDKSMGWKRTALGGLEIHKIPGDHDTLLSLGGKDFAQLLRKWIDAALPASDREEPWVNAS